MRSLRSLFIFGFIILAGTIHPLTPAQASPSSCAKDFIGKLVLGPDSSRVEPFTAKEIRAAIKASIKKGLKPKVLLRKAGKFLIYPSIAPHKLYSTVTEQSAKGGWKGLARVPLEYLRKDGLTALGYVAFYQAVGGTPIEVINFYGFSKNENGDFERDTAIPERKDGITVYVDGVQDANGLAGYGEKDFKLRFEKREGAVYIHARDSKDMMEQIKKATADAGKPVAELEILGHGLPGTIKIGGSTLNSNSLSLVEGYSVPFAKDALIRVQSCYLGANLKGDLGKPGETFMNGLGTRLLNQGGKVVASNRIVYVTENFTEQDQKTPKGGFERAVEVYAQPLELLMHAGFEAALDLDEPYREVVIPQPLNENH